MILIPPDDKTKKQIEQIAISRNRSTIGRRSGNIIDIYIAKGQIIARLWPIDQIYEPSEAYQRAQQMTVIQRRIEKYFTDNDRIAWKLRAARSRYNWWEVFGKVYLPWCFRTPDLVSGFKLNYIEIISNKWTVQFITEHRCRAFINFIYPGNMFGPGHNWTLNTHREAGLENTLYGHEVMHADKRLMQTAGNTRPYRSTFAFAKTYMPSGSFFWIDFYRYTTPYLFKGQSGIYMLTLDKPWWLNAPLSPERC